MGITLLAAVVTLFSYLAADILYVVVDPRITYE
jgi:ABC-type dipeptide/oligopeptide/nickel transport system permease component